jgi:hypothetical protein
MSGVIMSHKILMMLMIAFSVLTATQYNRASALEEKTGDKEKGQVKVIDGVDRYRVMEACYEGVRVMQN